MIASMNPVANFIKKMGGYQPQLSGGSAKQTVKFGRREAQEKFNSFTPIEQHRILIAFRDKGVNRATSSSTRSRNPVVKKLRRGMRLEGTTPTPTQVAPGRKVTPQ